MVYSSHESIQMEIGSIFNEIKIIRHHVRWWIFPTEFYQVGPNIHKISKIISHHFSDGGSFPQIFTRWDVNFGTNKIIITINNTYFNGRAKIFLATFRKENATREPNHFPVTNPLRGVDHVLQQRHRILLVFLNRGKEILFEGFLG